MACALPERSKTTTGRSRDVSPLCLAGVLGLGLGWASWNALLAGTFLGWTLAAASRLALHVTHKVSRDAPIPLGAFLITGTVAVLLANPTA